MIAFKVETLQDAQNLVNLCEKYPFNIDAMCGVQNLNAKSILGVTSFLGRFISLIPQTEDEEAIKDFASKVKVISNC